MNDIRNILNGIKWTKKLEDVRIIYLHRGAKDEKKTIAGTDIVKIKKSYLETKSSTIPYHRILKIVYCKETLFDHKVHRGRKN